MRLIDLDAFREEYDLREHCEDCGRRNKKACDYPSYSARDFCGWLDDVPTIDAVPVVHGRWIITSGMKPPEYHHMHQCSVCETYALRLPPYGNREALSPWCPACGAKMDLEETNANQT